MVNEVNKVNERRNSWILASWNIALVMVVFWIILGIKFDYFWLFALGYLTYIFWPDLRKIFKHS